MKHEIKTKQQNRDTSEKYRLYAKQQQRALYPMDQTAGSYWQCTRMVLPILPRLAVPEYHFWAYPNKSNIL